ncbi:MAG: hypothetical protein HWN65_16810 [Candidatus Helarchaeota archaeon]|nr:hypothetical protein [Candidatus Helarchaeota archaeon]
MVEREKTPLSEEEQRRKLETERKDLEEQRRTLLAEAEGYEANEEYANAGNSYQKAADISNKLGEKDRSKIFSEKVKEMRKKEIETRKATEIERKKEVVEKERDELLEQADIATQEGRFDDSVRNYEQAIELSKQIGDKDFVRQYSKTLKELKERKAELIRRFQAEKEIRKLEQDRREILRRAEDAVSKEDYMRASKFYKDAVVLSDKMGQRERSEMFASRAKEMLEIAEDIKKREEEERARAEMESKRIDLEDKRARSLASAEAALEKGNFKSAATAYETAAKLSLDLGEKEVATGFTAQARDIREKEPELRREFREEKRRVKIRKEQDRLLGRADKFLEREEFLEASRIYVRSAELSKDVGEKDRAKEFDLRADECRRKEKEKRDELLDRSAKALRAVITLRLMEPAVASRVFAWDELTAVVKIWDIGSVTLNFKEGEATITRGEAAKYDILLEGTSENVMNYCSGRYSHRTMAKWRGKVRTRGKKGYRSRLEFILCLPPLEKEVEKQYVHATIFVGIMTGILAFLVFIYLNPALVGSFISQSFKDIADLILAGGGGSLDPFLGWLASFLQTFPSWAIIFFLYSPGVILLSIFILYYFIQRLRFEGEKKRKTKERKRVIRRAIVSQAESSYKDGRFIDAARLWQKAALISVELADEDRAAEYAVRAHALRGKTTELKKKWKIERKTELEAKMRKEMTSRRDTLETERKKILEEAAVAEDSGNLLEASRAYKLASKLSLEIGEKERARELSEKSKESKRREADMRRRRKTEVARIRESEKIEKFDTQMKEAMEIAEVALGEERWDDAIKYYTMVVRFAGEMGDKERAKAFEAKVVEIQKKAELEAKREKLEEKRRLVIIEAEAANADGNIAKAANLYEEAGRISLDLGEKDVAEGFKATAAELRSRR